MEVVEVVEVVLEVVDVVVGQEARIVETGRLVTSRVVTRLVTGTTTALQSCESPKVSFMALETLARPQEGESPRRSRFRRSLIVCSFELT